MKRTLLFGALALALGGCAAGPYYDNGYGYGPAPGYYDNGPTYYYGAPGYYDGPSVGLGYYYYDNDGGRHWHDNRDDHNGSRQWHDRGDHQSLPDLPGTWNNRNDDGRHGNLGPGELRNDNTRSGGPNSDHSAVQQ